MFIPLLTLFNKSCFTIMINIDLVLSFASILLFFRFELKLYGIDKFVNFIALLAMLKGSFWSSNFIFREVMMRKLILQSVVKSFWTVIKPCTFLSLRIQNIDGVTRIFKACLYRWLWYYQTHIDFQDSLVKIDWTKILSKEP